MILRDLFAHFVDSCVRQILHSRANTREGKAKKKASVSGNEAWLAALTSSDASVGGEPNELRKLAHTLEEWSRPAFNASHDTLRTCFRLSAPEEDKADETQSDEIRSTHKTEASAASAKNSKWRVDFLLQATDEQSLLVPAETIWKTKGEALDFADRRLENPQEKLLADLGRAARLYPDLEAALKTARPVTLKLDATGAYKFLREAAPLLEQSGFGVHIPAWLQKPTARLGVKIKTALKSNKGTGSGLLGLDQICEYAYQIALGDEQISFDDFIKLASLKVPLVKFRGQWVELKREEIDAALQFFAQRQAAGEMTLGEMLRISYGIDTAPVGLPVVGVEARGTLGALLATAGGRQIEQLTTPEHFNGRLRPYQERGLAWLSFLDGLGLGACLADDMGLGKTPQLLALLVAEKMQDVTAKKGRKQLQNNKPTLLICPMSIVGNWQRETARFAPRLRVHVHHGAGRLTGRGFVKAIKNSDLVMTTYALAMRDEALLGEIEWRRIVLDEAQNIKNAAAKQTQAIRRLKAHNRVALTGTPVENRLSELWSIMDFLNTGMLGSAGGFRTRFGVPIERYGDETKAALLKQLTAPFVLRRLKTDKSIIQDLPDKLEMKTYCNLTREQATLYQAVVDEMLERIEASDDTGIERKGLVLATLMKLKQVCNHPAQLLKDNSCLAARSGKLERLEETLEEIFANDERALCFTQFAEFGKRLKEHLQNRFGREVLFLHGGTNKNSRDEMIARFQGDSGASLFLLSLKAGGVGLNLTAANHVIHFDRWWNPAVENQATDRAFRIGQRKNVQVRKFICVGTLEERIDEMIERKKELAERIVGTGEAWLTELSTVQLRELVALSSDAVSES
ncbi:MAG: DEAD/DEAH box helicase [Pyrinomonadaceae bacterium]